VTAAAVAADERSHRFFVDPYLQPQLFAHPKSERGLMCRNIKTLANFEPPATDDEVRASALQFVRKLSGTTHPSRANEEAFDRAVEEITASARRLIDSIETKSSPRNREEESRKARMQSAKRFGTSA
jgi:hypothetical protein